MEWGLDCNRELPELNWITTSSVPQFDAQKKYHSVKNFRIGGTYNVEDEQSFEYGGEGGTTLESLGLDPVQIGYIELGEPCYDDAGEIKNAILLCPYYSGCSSNMLDFWSVEGSRIDFSGGSYIGPGQLFDTDKYYIIIADTLGLWGASKPSSSHPGKEESYALGLDFPQYNLEDCVQLMYRLLKDKLHITQLKLVTGVSMGGSLTYAWGVLHPDFMESILPIGATPFQDSGMACWLFDLMTAAIISDPVYQNTKGNYYAKPKLEHPIMGNLFGWSLLKHSAFVDELRMKQGFEHCKQEIFDWEKSKEVVTSKGKSGYGSALFGVSLIDSNDIIYRNRAQGMFNVEKYLPRVKAKTLIIHITTDQWLYLHLAKRAHEGIKESKLITFSDEMGHYAVFKAPGLYKREIEELLA